MQEYCTQSSRRGAFSGMRRYFFQSKVTHSSSKVFKVPLMKREVIWIKYDIKAWREGSFCCCCWTAFWKCQIFPPFFFRLTLCTFVLKLFLLNCKTNTNAKVDSKKNALSLSSFDCLNWALQNYKWRGIFTIFSMHIVYCILCMSQR